MRLAAVLVAVLLLLASGIATLFYLSRPQSLAESMQGVETGSALTGRPCVGEAVALYVSPKGSDSWSGLFPDPLPDGSDGPLATLEAARDRVRELRRQRRRVTVYLRGGVYHLSASLVLGPEDSGGEGCLVVWQAYPGEEPIISGGLRITGFRQVDLGGRSAWVAEVPRGWSFKQLFVNGERRPRSRLPKEGFYKIAGVPSYAGKRILELQLFEGADEFSFEPGQLRAWRNLQEVDVVILHFWVEERIPLRSVDESRGVAGLSAKTVFAIRDGFAEEYPRYYVENVFEALSEPGEWYLDAAEGFLYYLPKPGEDPSSSVVVAPRLVWRLLEVKGEPERGRFVENIVIRGLTFECTDWAHTLSPQAAVNVPGAIYLRGARNVVIEDCTVRLVGGYAIEIGEGCRGVRVEGCRLYDLGAGGIKVGTQHVPRSEWEKVEFIEVAGNRIERGGRVFHSAVGVWVGQARFVRVVANEIADLFYTGVSVGWTWGYGESFACCNLIEGNVIHDIGAGLLSDMGGVYTLGVQPGTAVRCNIIYNVSAYQYGGWGVYLDEGSSYIVVEGNVVYDTTHGGFHQHYGRWNIVRDNIFALGREANIVLSRGEEGQVAFIFERNIVLSNGSPIFQGGYAQRYSMRNIVSDRNVYWDPTGRLTVCREQATGREYTLDEWRALGYDRLSIVDDPLFASVELRDFTLRDSSPALRLGFRRLCRSGQKG
ncbi:MAG: right-handed parallel beta-helix repeat-containing protein [Thermofilaceae archaeon]